MGVNESPLLRGFIHRWLDTLGLSADGGRGGRTHRSDDLDGAHLCVAAPPHPPVLVVPFLQEVLVAAKPLLLEPHPAGERGQRHDGLENERTLGTVLMVSLARQLLC